MLINGTLVNERHNNPPVLSKTALRIFFMQDGQYFDPYQISAVSIFASSKTYSPETVLNSEELINASAVSASFLMNFANSSPNTADSSFNVSNYTGNGASGIYRLGIGQYAVILDGVSNQSGVINLYGINQVIKNSVSNIGDFVDVWTVNMVAGSELETIFNYFKLTRGNFFTITEPIMFRTRSKLVNNSIVMGSRVDLKIDTEITIENSNISEEIKNVIKDQIIQSAALEIYKINEEAPNVPSRVTVSSFTDTSSLVTVTSDNTILFNWDTNLLKSHPQALLGNFAGVNGVYAVQAKYNLFNERILSPLMHLTVE